MPAPIFDCARFSGVQVPHGLGDPDKVAEAGYYIRDNRLPSCFRGVRCVVSATAKTGKMGPSAARLRLFFLMPHPVADEALCAWTEALWKARPDLGVDPSVMGPHQCIFTGRPILFDCIDPVPKWSRVRVLDGCDDYVTLEDLPKGRIKPKSQSTPALTIAEGELPEWLAPLDDAECAPPEVDASRKAKTTVRGIFSKLKGCPTGHDEGRHKTLIRAAWTLALLVVEGEISETEARKAYSAAAAGIKNDDGKYDDDAIQERLDSAFAKIWRR